MVLKKNLGNVNRNKKHDALVEHIFSPVLGFIISLVLSVNPSPRAEKDQDRVEFVDCLQVWSLFAIRFAIFFSECRECVAFAFQFFFDDPFYTPGCEY